MKTTYVYCVPWIEVEFGGLSRPEGFGIFLHEHDAIDSTLESVAVAQAAADDGNDYLGPELPPYYFKVPIDCLEPSIESEMKQQILTEGLIENNKPFAWSASNYWRPEIKSNPIYIKQEKKE